MRRKGQSESLFLDVGPAQLGSQPKAGLQTLIGAFRVLGPCKGGGEHAEVLNFNVDKFIKPFLYDFSLFYILFE